MSANEGGRMESKGMGEAELVVDEFEIVDYQKVEENQSNQQLQDNQDQDQNHDKQDNQDQDQNKHDKQDNHDQDKQDQDKQNTFNLDKSKETPVESRFKRQLHGEDLNIIDPESFRVVKSRKRVLSTVITKLWEPLDDTTINSVYKLLHICLGKTMQRYKLQDKVKESRRILTNSWIENTGDSFLSRLKVTNLPSKSTMTSKINQISDVMNYDLIMKRNKYLQTLLSAELNQLNDLQLYYNKCQLNYQVDYDYLQQFKKTIQKQHREPELVLDFPNSNDNINLKQQQQSSFVPENDAQISSILSKLNSHLNTLDQDTKKLQATYDKVKIINNMIELLL